MSPTPETVLDMRGARAPLPSLRANKLLRGLPPGARVRLLTTDRRGVADLQSFCREAGHALIAFSEEGDTLVLVIRRGADRTP